MTAPTADAVHRMIRRHYLPENRPAAGVLAEEIDSPDGKRRADAIWMPMTYAGDRSLVGMEVKVSRSDIAAELADPTKSDAWARYCGRWWLVIPDPKLIDGLEDRIPEHWGVYGPPSGRRTRSMTALRPARKLTPVDTGPAFRRLAVWIEHRKGAALSELRSAVQFKERELAEAQRQIDQLRAAQVSGTNGRDPLAEQVLDIMRKARAEARRQGVYLRSGGLDTDRIVAALLDCERVEDACDTARYELRTLVSSVERAVKPMESTARELAKLTPPKIEVPAVASS